MIVDVLRQRMMVAEFVARQQSGSPVNGETPTNHNNSNMPAHSALLLTNGGPMSPQSPGPENFPSNNYDLSAHLRKKDLFSQRKQREFIPDAKKDESYWDRRRRNNEAAKRSREKRRFNDMVLEQRVVELTKENHVLKAQLEAIKDKYNICGENLVSVDQIMATLPTSEQVLSITKRPKLNHSVSPQRMMYPGSPSPVPTSVIHQNISNNSSSSCSNSNTSPSPPGLMQQRDPTPQQHIGSPGSPSPMPNAVPPQSALQLHPQPHHHHLHQPHHPSGIPPHALIHAQQQQASQHPHHHISSQQGQSPHNMASPFGIRREQPPTHNSSSASSSPPVQQHHHGLPPGVVGVVPSPQQQQQQPHDEYTTTTTTSSSTPHHYALYEPVPTHFQQGTSVLNLSRRAHSPSYEASSVASSVEDDHDMHADQQNNSLPLKLRHKSHLGDKDAATALLALHNIKQEPNPRASPPWDGEGSSDERDSGISIGAPDWTATIQRKIIVNHQAESNAMHDKEEENIHLKSKLARLESEVATIKNMMILNTSNGATAAAQ